jgi:hypothetical protein
MDSFDRDLLRVALRGLLVIRGVLDDADGPSIDRARIGLTMIRTVLVRDAYEQLSLPAIRYDPTVIARLCDTVEGADVPGVVDDVELIEARDWDEVVSLAEQLKREG